MTTKTCPRCKRQLHIDAFSFRNRKQGVRNSACKECVNKYYERIPNRASALLNTAQKRSKAKGVPFEITQDWAERKLTAGYCEATGLPFRLQVPESTFHGAYSPSVDQRIAGLGYTKENSQMVLQAYNNFKGQYDEETIYEIAKAIVAKGPPKRRLPDVLVRLLETSKPSGPNASSV